MFQTKHGLSRSRFYRIYKGVITRGNNIKIKEKYNIYCKDIVCEWKSFEDFKKDMYESYLQHCQEFGEKNTSIDRIENNKNYCKNNCRWATKKQQLNNRSCTLVYEGELIKDICYRLGVKYNSVIYRLRRGWSHEEAIFTPMKTKKL